MSATTTANPVSGAVLNILKDYDIHHGNPENPGTPEPPNSQRDTPKPILNPEHWDNEHRRVPSYKPIDKRKRGPERPDGSNPIEVAFIFLMLNGCGLIGRGNSAWRATGGKLNAHIFRYKIGGEW